MKPHAGVIDARRMRRKRQANGAQSFVENYEQNSATSSISRESSSARYGHGEAAINAHASSMMSSSFVSFSRYIQLAVASPCILAAEARITRYVISCLFVCILIDCAIYRMNRALENLCSKLNC